MPRRIEAVLVAPGGPTPNTLVRHHMCFLYFGSYQQATWKMEPLELRKWEYNIVDKVQNDNFMCTKSKDLHHYTESFAISKRTYLGVF
jgi:hypothetical protein